jgi:mannose-6-phosphate isomerase
MPRRIIGVEKNYDWGDSTSIASALGLPASSTPIAEYWWGTHPQGPSHVDEPNGTLLSVLSGEMSVMVKLLACDKPLSLQTHPTLEQADHGFIAEETAGIDRDASHRLYRDASDKPEMLIALSRFEALCGFADTDSSLEHLRNIGWHDEADVLEQNGIDGYLPWAFEQDSMPAMSNTPAWLQRIAELHPHDRGLRVAPLLNYVVLQPGEAMCLPAGNLHAYLHGFGLEVMKSSDNVVRAGFTSKHVDVPELLRIVDTTPLENPVVSPSRVDNHDEYPSPSPAFSVACVHSKGHVEMQPSEEVRIVLTMSPAKTEAFFVAPNESATFVGDGPVWVVTQN